MGVGLGIGVWFCVSFINNDKVIDLNSVKIYQYFRMVWKILLPVWEDIFQVVSIYTFDGLFSFFKA